MNDENTQSPEVTPSEAPAVETTSETALEAQAPETPMETGPEHVQADTVATGDDCLQEAVMKAVGDATADEGIAPADLKIETVEDLAARVLEQLGVSLVVSPVEGEEGAVKVSAEIVDAHGERSVSTVIRNNSPQEILGFYFSVADAAMENKAQNADAAGQ